MSEDEKLSFLGEISEHTRLLYALLSSHLGEAQLRTLVPNLFALRLNAAKREACALAVRALARRCDGVA